MSKIAIIRTGGKQYKVALGQTLQIEKLEAKDGETVKFDTLLSAEADGKEVNIGKPSLGDLVEAKVIETAKDDKVRVVKYKNKTRYLRTKGHRQLLTKVEIVKIS